MSGAPGPPAVRPAMVAVGPGPGHALEALTVREATLTKSSATQSLVLVSPVCLSVVGCLFYFGADTVAI